MRAFADALDCVPMALAENSGLSPIETLANIKSRQAKEKNTRLGVDCMQTGSNGESTFSYMLIPTIISIRVAAVLGRYQQDVVPFLPPLLSVPYRGSSPRMRGPVVHTCSRVQRLRGM